MSDPSRHGFLGLFFCSAESETHRLPIRLVTGIATCPGISLV